MLTVNYCCESPRCLLVPPTLDFGTVSGYPLSLLQALQQVILTLGYTGDQAWGKGTKSLKYIHQIFPNAMSHAHTFVTFR
jgi:hypothetical protein